jgi:hypothetical protein
MEKIVINITGDGPRATRTFFDLVEAFSGPAVKRSLVMGGSLQDRPRKAFLISASQDVEIKLSKP